MRTLYFAYGSNMCSDQLTRRFEGLYRNGSKTYRPIAIAKLDNFSWFINNRGYANIMPVPTARKQSNAANQGILPPGPLTNDGKRMKLISDVPSGEVWGLLYSLNSTEIARLDECEGYSIAKRGPAGTENRHIRHHKQGRCSYNKLTLDVEIMEILRRQPDFALGTAKALCYVDEVATGLGRMTERYRPRLQAAVIEAKQRGVPKKWLKAMFAKEGLSLE